MHGVDENSMTGASSAEVVNGNINPPATSQISDSLLSTKVVNNISSNAITSGNIALCQQQGTVINIMSRPGTVTAGTPNGTPGMQIVNMRPNQSIPVAGARGLPPRMIVNQIPNVRPGQPGQPLTLQSISGLPPGTQGHLIVKTDNGQLQLVRVNPAPATTNQIPPNGTPTNTMVVQQASNTGYRLPQPQTSATLVTLANSAPVNSQVVSGHHAVSAASVPTSTSSVGSVITTSATTVTPNASQAQTSPAVGTQTISAESAKTKCKNFLATLLRLASEQRAKVAQNVRNLIQGLIDGKVEPEAFTEELQKDLNSSPQPCLVPFLKKTLPYLRASLAKGELSIDGVRPPPLSAVVPVTGMTTVIPSMVGIVRTGSPAASGLRVVNPTQGTIVHRPSVNPSSASQPLNNARLVSQVHPVRLAGKTVVTAVKPTSVGLSASSQGASGASGVGGSSSVSSSSSHVNNSSSSSGGPTGSAPKSSSKTATKDEKKSSKDKNVAFNSFGSVVGDDDINDVAAMGGVNLGEESQRILDSTGFVGTQIRSCKDEVFAPASALQSRIKQIASEHGLEEPSKEVVALVSHAVQERLKTLVEKVGVIAEHRLDLVRAEPRYEVLQDVKGQLKFLEELDKLEKKRKDEYEREILLRAAKSRSKTEDPEQVKLKAKAKEMQRVELEEMRQRDANMTALKALQGPRKKAKVDGSTEEQGSFSGTFTQKQMPLRPRVKRVNLRDMMFMMEQEKDLRSSHTLYKSFLK